ncbi:MAG: thioredoxin [Flavobacteriaceae bacterium]|nr:thioredoxin [Flavobacteriaceae bacterium]
MAELLTKETFKNKVFDFDNKQDWEFAGERPAIVDFYADWCGPCKMLAPIFEELSKEYEGKIDFYKVDTEQEQQISGMFGIRSIPTIMFMQPDGQEPQVLQGALPKAQLIEVIEQVFGIKPN